MLATEIVLTTIAVILFVYTVAIRPWQREWGSSHLDRVAQLPGDELSPHAPSHITHAIEINAPPEAVWPHLEKIVLERAKQSNLAVAVARPPQALALVTAADLPRVQSAGEATDATWAFFLKPMAGGKTRLIARLRAVAFPGLWTRAADFFYRETAHFVAERKMLQTIKAKAEQKDP
jgi:hypothetical protein